MILLGIKYDSGWRNQPVIVKEENGIILISNYGKCQTSSQMFGSSLRKKVSAEEVSRNFEENGHIFNHLGISADLNIMIGEQLYKILARKNNDKVTLISGYVEASHLSNIVNAICEEIAEELLIRTGEGHLLLGKKFDLHQKVFDLEKAYDVEKDLVYGKFVPSKHTEFHRYSQALHYLLTPSRSELLDKIKINEKEIPKNFEIYIDGRTNGIQLVERLQIELMAGHKRLKSKSNLRFIEEHKLSFYHAEDKRVKKDEELHTFFHSFGIILAELQNYGEHSIGPERLTGKFFIVEDGKVKQTQPPKVLSERFSKMSPLEFVESDITLEEYLSEE